jgi:hypothetical protein
VPPPPNETEQQLNRLEAELKRLEAEYNMFFAGRSARPPWETRSRVKSLIAQLDRTPKINTGEKFRFTTLQTRFSTFVDLWDRSMRAREEGRASALGGAKERSAERGDRVVYTSTFKDPSAESDKLRALYNSVAEARRGVGAENVPFERFAQLIKHQVEKMKGTGVDAVAFRVTVKDGKVNFTARPLKPGEE